MISSNAKRAIEQLPGYSPEQRSGVRINCEKMIAGKNAAGRVDAEAVLAAMDAMEQTSKETAALRWSSQPEADRIQEGLLRKSLTPSEQKLVQVLLDHPNATLSELDGHAGLKGGWHMLFGTMSKNRFSSLLPAPPAADRRKPSNVAKWFCGILTDFDDGSRGFTMKPAAVEAFSRLGLRAQNTPH